MAGPLVRLILALAVLDWSRPCSGRGSSSSSGGGRGGRGGSGSRTSTSGRPYYSGRLYSADLAIAIILTAAVYDSLGHSCHMYTDGGDVRCQVVSLAGTDATPAVEQASTAVNSTGVSVATLNDTLVAETNATVFLSECMAGPAPPHALRPAYVAAIAAIAAAVLAAAMWPS
jgi:hypothetical protein